MSDKLDLVIRIRTLLLLFACFAFLVMRIDGAHLHRCFDGAEPPNDVHFADFGLHHLESPAGQYPGGTGHEDIDSDVTSDAVSKLASVDLPVLAGFLFAIALLLPRGRHLVPRPPTASRLFRSPLHLRPPLRGPPRFSFA